MTRAAINKQNLRPAARFSATNQPTNPGRKKGGRDRATVLRKWLEAKITRSNPVSGELEKLPAYDHVALSLIAQALDGNIKAIKEIQDTVFGKLPETRQSSTHGEIVFRWANQLGAPSEIEVRPSLPAHVDGELLEAGEPPENGEG
jgi:hypothetical protein